VDDQTMTRVFQEQHKLGDPDIGSPPDLDTVNTSSQLIKFTKLLSDPDDNHVPPTELLTPTTITEH